MNKKNKRPAEFISIDAMPHCIVSSGGRNLALHYDRYPTPLGDMVLAASSYGLSHALFESGKQAEARLQKDYPKADIIRKHDPHHLAALRFFDQDEPLTPLKLVLKGTRFQRVVWRALLDVGPGQVSSYAAIARAIDKPKAFRAVGSAVGSNPVSFFVPCHRILASNGTLGGYYWGLDKKRQLLDWEAANFNAAMVS